MTSLVDHGRWIVLAYLAELARDERCEINLVPRACRTDTYRNTATAITIDISKFSSDDADSILGLLAGHERSTQQQWAERMMLSASELAAAPAAPVIPEVGRRHACPICLAPPDHWCIPVHDGERRSMDWLHPARGSMELPHQEFRPHPRALHYAHEVLEGRYGRSTPRERALAMTVLAQDRRAAVLTGRPPSEVLRGEALARGYPMHAQQPGPAFWDDMLMSLMGGVDTIGGRSLDDLVTVTGVARREIILANTWCSLHTEGGEEVSYKNYARVPVLGPRIEFPMSLGDDPVYVTRACLHVGDYSRFITLEPQVYISAQVTPIVTINITEG